MLLHKCKTPLLCRNGWQGSAEIFKLPLLIQKQLLMRMCMTTTHRRSFNTQFRGHRIFSPKDILTKERKIFDYLRFRDEPRKGLIKEITKRLLSVFHFIYLEELNAVVEVFKSLKFRVEVDPSTIKLQER